MKWVTPKTPFLLRMLMNEFEQIRTANTVSYALKKDAEASGFLRGLYFADAITPTARQLLGELGSNALANRLRELAYEGGRQCAMK